MNKGLKSIALRDQPKMSQIYLMQDIDKTPRSPNSENNLSERSRAADEEFRKLQHSIEKGPQPGSQLLKASDSSQMLPIEPS